LNVIIVINNNILGRNIINIFLLFLILKIQLLFIALRAYLLNIL